VLDASGQVQVLGRTSDGVWNRRFVWNRLDSAAIEVIPQVGLVAILKTGNVVVFSQHASGRWSSSISCDDNGARGGQPGLGIRAHLTGFYSLSFSAVASWSRQPDLRYTAKIMFEFPGLKCFSPAPTGEFLTASVTKTLLWWCPDGRGRFHATSLGEMSSSPSAVGSLPSGILFSIDSLGEILTFDRSSTHKVPALAQRSSLGVADVRAVQVTARDELIVHNPDGVHVFAADVNERWRRTHFVRLIPKQGTRPGEARVNASHMVPDGRIIAATSDGSGECELQILDGISG